MTAAVRWSSADAEEREIDVKSVLGVCTCRLFVTLLFLARPCLADELTANDELQIVVDADGFNGAPATGLAVSDDGTWLAASSDKVVRLWNLKSGQQLPELRGYQEPFGFQVGGINALVFSPGSRFLLVGVTDNTEVGSTRVYDLREAGSFHDLIAGHLGCTRGVAFSPDGQHLATWGCDGQIIVSQWDEASGSATRLFSTDWSGAPEIPESWKPGLAAAEPYLAEANRLYGEGRIQDSLSALRKMVDVRRRVYGSHSELLKSDLRFLSRLHREQSDSVAADRLQAEADQIDPELMNGGCFSFLDNEVLVFSHCGTTRIVSLREQRNLNLDEQPAVVTRIREEADRAEGSLTGTVEFTGQSHTDLSAFRSGGGPWLALCTRTLSNRQYRYAAGLWRYGAAQSSVSHQHHYDTTAITFNNRSGLAASSDRLGGVEVWRIRDNTSAAPRVVPNAARLWNVNWGNDVLYFAATSYPQGRFRENDRGPLDRMLDFKSMSILPVDTVPAAEDNTKQTGAENFSLQMGPGERPGTRSLKVVRGSNSQPLSSGELKSDDGRPLRSLAMLDTAWSYCFVDYPGMDSHVHLLVGDERGELVEGILETDQGGNPQFTVVRRFLGHSAAISAISVSPDHTRFLSSSLDGSVRIWNLDPPRVLADVDCLTDGSRVVVSRVDGLQPGDVLTQFGNQTFFERLRGIFGGQYQAGDTVTIAISRMTPPDRDSPAAARQDLTLTTTLKPAPDLVEPIVSVFISSDGEVVAWNSQGFYNASANGARHLGFHRNRARHLPAEFYTSEQFLELHRPNLVFDAFRGSLDSAPAAAPILVPTTRSEGHVVALASHSSPKFSEIAPPKVRIVSPANGESLESGGELEIRIEAEYPSSRQLTGVTLNINDIAVPARPVGEATTGPDGLSTERFVVKRRLDPGEVTLIAAAMHEKGQSESRPATVTVRGSEVRDSEQGNLYAVCFGVANHEETELRLQTARNDASRVAEALQQLAGANQVYGTAEVRQALDEQATRAEMIKSLKWLREHCQQKKDLAVIYVNAHALLSDDGQWFLVPHDCDSGDPEVNGLKVTDLLSAVSEIPRAVLLFDVFHGHPRSGIRDVPFPRSKKCSILACAQLEVKATEGAFADGIVKTLSEAQGGLLKVDQFFESVRDAVRESTTDRQTPVLQAGDPTQKAYLLAGSQ